jgi:hypothetical protein
MRAKRTGLATAACFLSLGLLLIAPGAASAITRSQVIANAKSWTDIAVPYSQKAYHDGYRTDCSGFVSMAWGLAKPGLSTTGLSALSVAHQITKAQLQPGDVLLDADAHVVIFAGWTDATQTHYTAYEEVGPDAWCALKSDIPYPYWPVGLHFLPYRFNGIQDDPPAGVSDSFDDSKTDSALWSETTGGSGPSVAELGGQLRFTIPPGSIAESADWNDGRYDYWAGYTSQFRLHGDFDVEVSFQLNQWPYASGVRFGLFFGEDGTSTRLGSFERTSWGSSSDFSGEPREVYVAYDMPSGHIADVATSDAQGRLRVQRAGATLSTFFWSGGAWVPVETRSTTSDNMWVSLLAFSNNDAWNSATSVVAALDDFSATGQIIWPASVVTPTVSLKLGGLKSGALAHGKTLSATGLVTPLSLAGSRVKIALQRKSSRNWLGAAIKTQTITASGFYYWVCKPATKGTYRIRATIGKTAKNVAADTAWQAFRVK